jgi:ribosomal protein S18 acetylase RimI-like enzyme
MPVIDRAAFDPLWWRSERSVRHRAAGASHFLMAELNGRVVGYVEMEQHFAQGHINRLAVLPSQQQKGVGGSLLRRTLDHLWRSGAEIVSLNTQQTNHASRRLYGRFGFSPTGASTAVWVLALNSAP